MLAFIQRSMKLNLNVTLSITPTGNSPLWVVMPAPMPRYGTSAFRAVTARVFLRQDVINRESFTWLVSASHTATRRWKLLRT